MKIFPVFQTVLYIISSALLYPVVVLLIGLCVWIIIYTGGFFGEWARRKQKNPNQHLGESFELIAYDGDVPPVVASHLSPPVRSFVREIRDLVQDKAVFLDEQLAELIQRTEMALVKEVNRIRMIVRIGPSLGLMGTLIPMGTGLAGLTQGNIAQLSSNLILAFTTTVVGLALGITSYIFSIVKERWVAEDMLCIELIAEALTKGKISKGKDENEICQKEGHEQGSEREGTRSLARGGKSV